MNTVHRAPTVPVIFHNIIIISFLLYNLLKEQSLFADMFVSLYFLQLYLIWSVIRFISLLSYSLRFFHISFKWWFYIEVWMTANLFKSPGHFYVRQLILTVLSSGWHRLFLWYPIPLFFFRPIGKIAKVIIWLLLLFFFKWVFHTISNWWFFIWVWMTKYPLGGCPWSNGYRRRMWTRRHEFKSWTSLIAFHIALIHLGKVWIQIFSLQLWVNTRAD